MLAGYTATGNDTPTYVSMLADSELDSMRARGVSRWRQGGGSSWGGEQLLGRGGAGSVCTCRPAVCGRCSGRGTLMELDAEDMSDVVLPEASERVRWVASRRAEAVSSWH